MGKLYKVDTTRELPFLAVKAWHEGDSKELKKWIDFGFFNHIFVSENGFVTTYYDAEEIEEYDKILDEKFTDDLFNELCDHFFDTLKSENFNSDDEIFVFLTKIGPASTLFYDISNYPEFATDNMIRRLIRVRKTTESFVYDVIKNIKNKEPKDYIYHKGELHFIPFEQFLKECLKNDS